VSRKFIPHTDGLVDVLAAARQNDGLVIVVIEGINRGPTESFFLPVLRAAVGRGPLISIFHPYAVSDDDPYRVESRLEWPGNALLAATVVEGPTTLPVASDIWAFAALIETETKTTKGVESPEHVVEISDVAPGSPLFAPPEGTTGDPFDILDSAPELAAVRDGAERLATALRIFSSDARVITEDVMKAVVVPGIASIDDEQLRQELAARFATSSSLTDDDIRVIVERVRRKVG
jgi:hypothetical protein